MTKTKILSALVCLVLVGCGDDLRLQVIEAEVSALRAQIKKLRACAARDPDSKHNLSYCPSIQEEYLLYSVQPEYRSR